jgi:hypothetical protein
LGQNLSRKDDLECLGYSILALMTNNQFDWFVMSYSETTSNQEIKNRKERFSQKESPPIMFEGIVRFMKLVRALEFAENPNYA